MKELIVTTPAFEHEGLIPIEYTGYGADISPEFNLQKDAGDGSHCPVSSRLHHFNNSFVDYRCQHLTLLFRLNVRLIPLHHLKERLRHNHICADNFANGQAAPHFLLFLSKSNPHLAAIV